MRLRIIISILAFAVAVGGSSAQLADAQFSGGIGGHIGGGGAVSSFGQFLSPIKITLVYGQSRASNYSGLTDVCYSSTNPTYWQQGVHNPVKSFMMNNFGAPGPDNKADFISSLVTPPPSNYQSCLGSVVTGPAGQDLGSVLIYQQTDDVTFSRGNNARMLVVTGEGGQPIAALAKNATPTATSNSIVYVAGAADNGSGAIRLTVSSSTHKGGGQSGQLYCNLPGSVQPCTYSTGITDGSTQNLIHMNGMTLCPGAITQAPGGAGVWTVHVVDGTHIDLTGSNFSTAGPGGTPCNYNGVGSVGTGSGCTFGGNPCCDTFNDADAYSNSTNPIGFGCGQLGGFVIYTRMQNMLTKACALIVAVGKTCAVDTVLWLQGEADTTATPLTTYQTALTAMISNLRTDIPAITSQGTPFEFIMNPPVAAGDGTPLNATIAQYNTGILNADGHTWINGPEYQFPYATSEHQEPIGVLLDGEQFGRTRSGIQQGTWLGPGTCANSSYVCPTSISNSGATVTVNLNVPGSPTNCITLDTTQLPAATNNGFIWSDDSGKTISSVSITSCTQIQVVLSGTPTTTKTLSYAISGSGWSSSTPTQPPGWGNYRSSVQITSRYINPSDWSFALSDWMLSFVQTF